MSAAGGWALFDRVFLPRFVMEGKRAGEFRPRSAGARYNARMFVLLGLTLSLWSLVGVVDLWRNLGWLERAVGIVQVLGILGGVLSLRWFRSAHLHARALVIGINVCVLCHRVPEVGFQPAVHGTLAAMPLVAAMLCGPVAAMLSACACLSCLQLDRVMLPAAELQRLEPVSNSTIVRISVHVVMVGVISALGMYLHGEELRQAEEYTHELEYRVRRGKRAEDVKSAFLAHMSHEMRTPLSGIVGMAEILSRKLVDAGQKRDLSVIHTCGQSLLNIVTDVLDLAKITANKMELESVPFGLHEIINRAFVTMALRAHDGGVQLSCDLENLAPATGYRGDPTKLQQILINMLSNAVKFTKRGGEVMLRVSSTVQPADRLPERVRDASRVAQPLQLAPGEQVHRLLFEVMDTGVGIMPEGLGKLFEPFSQEQASTSRTYGGTGLGLTITQRLVHVLGGAVSVSSTPTRGCLFTFDLPLIASFDARRSPPVERSMNILLLDHSPIHGGVMTRSLEALSHRVTVARSADEATAVMQATGASVDLIVVNLNSHLEEDEAIDTFVRSYLQPLPPVAHPPSHRQLTHRRTTSSPERMVSTYPPRPAQAAGGASSRGVTGRPTMPLHHPAFLLLSDPFVEDNFGLEDRPDVEWVDKPVFPEALRGALSTLARGARAPNTAPLARAHPPTTPLGAVVHPLDLSGLTADEEATPLTHAAALPALDWGKLGESDPTLGNSGTRPVAAAMIIETAELIRSTEEQGTLARSISKVKPKARGVTRRVISAESVPSNRINSPNPGEALLEETMDRSCPVSPRDRLDTSNPGASEAEAAAATAAAPTSRLRILLAEDNPTNQTIALKFLELLGHRADLAHNGCEAVEMYRAALASGRPYTTVLMDLLMPELNGTEATAQIIALARARGVHAPHLVAVTADALQTVREECLANGFDDFLAKPFTLKRLEQAIAGAIAALPLDPLAAE